MKTKLYSIFAVWSMAVLLAGSLRAQTPESFSMRIPFDFVAGQRTLPAGVYKVQPMNRAIRIVNTSTKEGVYVLTESMTSPTETPLGKFAFDRYGDTYFLREVWRPTTSIGYQLHQSKRETELAKHAPGLKIESVIATK